MQASINKNGIPVLSPKKRATVPLVEEKVTKAHDYILYTDGSFVREDAACGWALVHDDKIVASGMIPLKRAYSPLAAETLSLSKGLEQALAFIKDTGKRAKLPHPKQSQLLIRLDNRILTRQLEKNRNFPGHHNLFVPFRGILRLLYSFMSYDVEWVKGHAEDPLNNLCDRLAKSGRFGHYCLKQGKELTDAFMEIGQIEVTGETLTMTDFHNCEEVTLKDVEPGEWKAYAALSTLYDCTKELLVKRVDVETAQYEWKRAKKPIWTRSGVIGVYGDEASLAHESLDGWTERVISSYVPIDAVPINELQNGAAAWTGFGPGIYDYYVMRNEGGKAIALRICFVDR